MNAARPREGARPLWSLAGAPLLWLAHFVAVYGVASLVCALPEALPIPPSTARWNGTVVRIPAIRSSPSARRIRSSAAIRLGAQASNVPRGGT